jgi:hypothetical protein
MTSKIMLVFITPTSCQNWINRLEVIIISRLEGFKNGRRRLESELGRRESPTVPDEPEIFRTSTSVLGNNHGKYSTGGPAAIRNS